MANFQKIDKPSKEEQTTALHSYDALTTMLKQVNSRTVEVEVEETKQKVQIPLRALKLLVKVLKAMGEGKAVSIAPVEAEVTTQSAAEILGCSRPHLVKLLETGEIKFTKVGRHRRIKIEDVMEYKTKMKQDQEKRILEMMRLDEEDGLYDS
ncbi:helix-turn-helix domain-containing protein [Microscilla marina]|uniref:Excisionase domain protein n=1 Tax=Microscilla marina ATCC 23134 TaxID=313606 RepID=A1ZKS2_MICM2|nr:helix-turn-helix domain-containing protein [Microscilla marina]EAY28888.1 excisionase domain protein [Microscilla marina ATCC 23134]